MPRKCPTPCISVTCARSWLASMLRSYASEVRGLLLLLVIRCMCCMILILSSVWDPDSHSHSHSGSCLCFFVFFVSFLIFSSYRDNRLDLVPLVSGPEWKLDQENLWRLPGAHGEEVVRSVCLDEQVCLTLH